jgi:hypothetical protein
MFIVLITIVRFLGKIWQVLILIENNSLAPVSRERLFGWHAAPFPAGYSGLSKIKVGYSPDTCPRDINDVPTSGVLRGGGYGSA